MPAIASPSNLVDLIQTLETQKQQHAESAAAVANTLEQISHLLGSLLGDSRSSTPHVAPKPAVAAKAPKAALVVAAKPPSAPAKAGKRQKFAVTAEQSVLAFVRRKGNPTTAEIQAHWESEGRRASADNSLSKLFREKKLKREPNKQGRGSRYTVA
jgi:hypothetical protein